MNALITHSAEFAATKDHLVGIGPLVAGVLLVGFLIGAFWLGRRIWTREPAPPTLEEQPHRPPDSGLPGEVEGRRRPAEVPQSERRLMPYELKHESTEPDMSPQSDDDRKWRGSPSGGFGSGGPTTGG
ncbi:MULTISPECIES: DUF6479 family protein [Streptomyces]|uniref:Secreted protein n=1 Tax=Streptomyces fradiae ATCC 10745 = DSM 40063 TaxID=1319510 RepID=A0A1Y2NPU3_STRFR|nr:MULTISPECIES: DUF6479 family protein [Streptomyces]KAF0646092.1 hypothetical protein K701_30555 [Streptomyces fradiae ATCC 10745 = DSM 40063]OSY49119.1 hypothetical protein BG846_05241 [Streptomyces fradiae ATCC 10745 = DSM 40063]QEV13359.1 hypothetical protein CP974_16695 [Streptomyces fradiae ATCC 10745 = DSM 40063]